MAISLRGKWSLYDSTPVSFALWKEKENETLWEKRGDVMSEQKKWDGSWERVFLICLWGIRWPTKQCACFTCCLKNGNICPMANIKPCGSVSFNITAILRNCYLVCLLIDSLSFSINKNDPITCKSGKTAQWLWNWDEWHWFTRCLGLHRSCRNNSCLCSYHPSYRSTAGPPANIPPNMSSSHHLYPTTKTGVFHLKKIKEMSNG